MVVVVTARPASFVVVTTPTDDDVDTPLNVDAASITMGVSVVASELPVVVSVATTVSGFQTGYYFVVNNGNVFSWNASKTVDSFLDAMSNYMDPRYNSSSATVYMCSTDVYNWFHKLGGYALQNLNIGKQDTGLDGTHAVLNPSIYTSDLAVAGRKKVLGLDTTTVNTVHGDMNLIRNIHLDGTQVKILGVNMNYAKYRPLVGNGINRDTAVYVGVQTLENSGVDRRVDQILTEAGMELNMPECHAVWK